VSLWVEPAEGVGEEEARRGGRLRGEVRRWGVWWKEGGWWYGRKLHAEAGRWDTSVKISEMRRCWTLVSWEVVQGWSYSFS